MQSDRNLLQADASISQRSKPRIAIGEVKARHCLGMDIKNWAMYAGCFTDDVELDTRPAGGRDRNEVLAILCRPVETVHTCRHIHSPAMTFNADGSADVIRADLIWAMQDRVTWGAGGHWRIARTKLARLHSDNHLEDGITQAAPNPVPG